MQDGPITVFDELLGVKSLNFCQNDKRSNEPNRWRFRNKNSRSENCSPKRGKIDWL